MVLHTFSEHEPVELAQQLIRIPSFLWQESEIGHWIAAWMAERGFSVDLQTVPLRDGRVTHQAIGTLKGDGTKPSLMLCGHTDTSDWNGDVFRRDQWTHDPFGAEIVDGVLYGLGAINMKGGVASILMAAEAVRRSGQPLKGDLIVACVVAETGGGVGALHLIASGLRPNYCIVAEAGNLDVGIISVGYVQGKVRVKGEFKHRVPYINPIEKITKVIRAFGPSYQPLCCREEGGWLRFQTHPLLPGFPAMAVRDISHHQDETTLTFDLRIIPGMTEDSVREDMTALLESIRADDPDFRYELIIPQSEQKPNMPAREATPIDSPLVAQVIAAHERVTGQRPNVGAGHRIGATADTCHFKGVGVQCVEYGPGFIPVWPMVDECIAVEQIVTATKTLALASASLCT
ncbi:MAG: M20/M25/M40 family metallo-hydrolase [Anaerolineae bacterium]|nr:M20/M25/M40 family metallo-hydrolase [Anaerolineae bacterium]MDW8172723.1 M20/M25/M40 family metallo-hydrolase [Anaerolineae bacterium]